MIRGSILLKLRFFADIKPKEKVETWIRVGSKNPDTFKTELLKTKINNWKALTLAHIKLEKISLVYVETIILLINKLKKLIGYYCYHCTKK